ncbi:hypothetical protein B0A58_08605 [Flavobacterium branchiophilum NBRC 15030 = ATCC 35035]|uniref:PH (Pleckstrin Homology) domain-containing protein n=1 Tax=Flavobacterium branchiophilum TaxID=55197 RepID=A0A543G6I9_9FLAO|nr:PH domain-containing protein [Flavobacterium branchiophilum]OXA75635.1 hypothetical protein B0A58_08605 [Flavobacterium branchiophilum NBRC 15030 = ATCC 35035]TQM41706.1 PH (Pleckstrin Homology) domain-containing protein [Flavobacterium branchiophilum]GEM55467.1 hypothetical protein FB1_16880 [Flavobacterium branchiophilum NBRC 15030 = ATCC 35035]
MDFQTTLDNQTKWITAGVYALFLGLICFTLFFDTFEIVTAIILLFILTVMTIATLYYKPKTIAIHDNEIIIKRPIGNVILKRTNIASIQILKKNDLKWSVRTFGIGGFFGYYGAFWNKKYGTMTWYLTRRNAMIMITTISNSKILISPDQVDLFVTTYQKKD